MTNICLCMDTSVHSPGVITYLALFQTSAEWESGEGLCGYSGIDVQIGIGAVRCRIWSHSGFVNESSTQINVYLCNCLSWVMINPKDKGWLLDMKLPLCSKYCLMLLLTYVLGHERAFALVFASSYTQSNVVVLVDLPVSPGHCCPALEPWSKVWMSSSSLACEDGQHLACGAAA